MTLSRLDKEFVFPLINQIDAKTIRVDRAFGNLLLLIKTKGKPVKATKKPPILIKNLEAIVLDQAHFSSLEGDRVGLLARWLESDFADIVRAGRGGSRGEAVLAGLKPLHLDVVKLRNPTHAKDYGTSRFLYSVIRQSPELLDAFEHFFGIGSQDDHYDGSDLDIETLFLLRLLDRYEFDRHSLRQPEVYYAPLCAGETAIFINDLQRVMLYASYVPRREVIRYLLTLTSFHLALSMLKTFRVVNGIVETGRGCESCGRDPQAADPTPNCPYRLDIFVDLSEQKSLCYTLAQAKVQKHYAELSRYIKNHIRLKKLDEFGDWLVNHGAANKPEAIMGLLELEAHPKLDIFCEIRMESLLTAEPGEERDKRLENLAGLGMNTLDTYVEMLYGPALRQKFHLKHHREMLDSFCGKNLDTGFLWVGRGRAGRRYYLGTELLETLVQVAVVDCHPKKGFYTRGITIADFVAWLKNRYGLLIDEYGEPVEGVELA